MPQKLFVEGRVKGGLAVKWLRCWVAEQKVQDATIGPMGKALNTTCSTLSTLTPHRGGKKHLVNQSTTANEVFRDFVNFG